MNSFYQMAHTPNQLLAHFTLSSQMTAVSSPLLNINHTYVHTIYKWKMEMLHSFRNYIHFIIFMFFHVYNLYVNEILLPL